MDGASQLFWNDATETLGIYDSTPDALFEISTPSGVGRDFFYVSNSSDGDILTVDNDGNVGINNSSPTYL